MVPFSVVDGAESVRDDAADAVAPPPPLALPPPPPLDEELSALPVALRTAVNLWKKIQVKNVFNIPTVNSLGHSKIWLDIA